MITPTEFIHDGETIKATINHGEQYWPFKIDKIETAKNCVYVGEFALNQGAGWTESPAAVFYQPNPEEGHSHYFGLLVRGDHVVITSGQSAADVVIIGKMNKSNEVIYSRFRHDYRLTSDDTVMIDGGRDYTKTSGPGRTVRMQIVKDELVILGFVEYTD
jgi:hypothetical protein